MENKLKQLMNQIERARLAKTESQARKMISQLYETIKEQDLNQKLENKRVKSKT